MKKFYLFFLAALFAASPILAQSITTSPLVATPFAQLPCPVLNQGISYSCQFTATGGVSSGGVYTWSEVGTLPTGLSFTSGGLLSGTPSSSSSFSVAFSVTDSAAGGNSTSGYTIPLQAQTLTGTGPCSAAICVGTGIGSVNTSATLQLQALAYFAGKVSFGLNVVDITSLASWSCTTGSGCTGSSINASGLFSSGTTTGSATAQASFNSVNGSSSLTVTGGSNPLVITYPTAAGGLPNGQIYQAYSEGDSANSVGQGTQFAVTGGTPPYTWTVSAGGPLPTGLTLSSGGLISGTGTASGAGVTTTFQVADSASHTQTVVISGGITIASVSTITANLAQSSIPANTSTNVSATATYSDSSIATIPTGMGGAIAYATATGTSASAAASVQVSSGTATTTGDFAIGIVFSWLNSSCTGYSASITSANETFNAATTAIGQSGAGPPFYNCLQMFYAQNITGAAADKPTCNWTATAGTGCLIRYYHGMLTSSTLDQHPSPVQSTSATSCAPTAVTTTAASELLEVFCAPNSATLITPPSGFTGTALVVNGSLAGVLSEAAVSAIQTSYAPTPTFTPSSNQDTLIATFKATSPANGTVTWASGTTTVATVASNTGVVTGLPVTTSSTSVITPTWVGSGSPSIVAATVTVNPNNTDTGIVVSPSTAFVAVGGTQVFSALGNVTGNSYQATWGSSNTGLATVNPASGPTTTATGVAAGSVTISAAVSGFTSASASLTVTTSSGQVINAATCNLSDVQAALPTSTQVTSPTVTVNIPSGTCTWTGQIAYTVPSSVTSMVIHGNTLITCSGAAGTSAYTCSKTDNTIIIDAFTGQNQPLLNIGTNTAALRITGISWRGGNIGTTVGKPNGFITASGSGVGLTALRIDHSVFDTTSYTGTNIGAMFTLFSQFGGVADHNIAFLRGESNGVRDYPEANGFTAWSQPTNFGQANASFPYFFVENNVINGGFLNDCNQGGRMVLRYNSMFAGANTPDTGGWQGHQTSQGTPSLLGCRALESYHNIFTNPTPSTIQSSVSGGGQTALSYSNTIGAGYQWDLIFWIARAVTSNNCGNSGGSGTAGCQPPPNAYGYCGSGSSGVLSVWDGNSASSGWPCLSQTGRGQGDLLTGTSFPNILNSTTSCVPVSPPGCSVWPHQKLEPWYSWNETIASGSLCNFETWSGTSTAANRDAYCQVANTPNTSPTSPFNGTVGTGFGPLANRPTTCTAGPGGAFGISPTGSYGVGYFATDMNGGAGELYVCTSTNTWTPVYQPYTYPHPLDQ